MKKKGIKILTLVLAFSLTIGASVAGTLAWLQASTGTVTNTFASANLFDNSESDFTLWEHKADDSDNDGKYDLTSTETTSNTYSILPGVNLPKDPTVDIVNLKEHAYLYIKVTNLPNDTNGLSAAIDSTNWEALSGYSGVYVYKGTNAEDNIIKAYSTSKKTFTVNILQDKQIVVANTYQGGTVNELSFTAYMVQATGNGDNAAAAWGNTYGAPANP